MAQIEALLVARLTGDSGVSELAGSRVHPDRLPQDVAYPAIRYLVLDRVEVLAKPNRATPRIVRARVQVDVYAPTYAGAKALGAAVKAAIYGWVAAGDGVIGARVVDESDANDAEETMQRVSLDASITYNE